GPARKVVLTGENAKQSGLSRRRRQNLDLALLVQPVKGLIRIENRGPALRPRSHPILGEERLVEGGGGPGARAGGAALDLVLQGGDLGRARSRRLGGSEAGEQRQAREDDSRGRREPPPSGIPPARGESSRPWQTSDTKHGSHGTLEE